MFVLGDLVIFALFFATFLTYRAEAPEVYAKAQATLNLTIGTANTIVLLTSSWLLAHAVKTVRTGAALSARPIVLTAILLGIAFIFGKGFEYVQKVIHGIDALEAEFFMFYFVFTGIHFVHVLVGLILLTLFGYSIKVDIPSEGRLRALEGSVIYWHMVDLLWIILFTLFYLIP